MTHIPPTPAFIPIAQPTLPPLEELQRGLAEILSGVELTNGREVERFEDEVAEALEAPHCVAVSSCTAGLMLVERCLGVRQEAITPSFTFFATAHGLLWNNVRPVLADCDPASFQVDPASVDRLLNSHTSAIVAVHLFGCPAPIDELERLATEAGVALIFDGAHALGARYQGRSVAARGDATVYSLSPTKQMTCGEGGLITTRHAELADALRRARNYGKGDGYDCDILGLNARLTELQASLGRAGLRQLGTANARRRELAAYYEGRLSSVPEISFQRIPPGAVSARKDFAIVLDPSVPRDALQRALRADGIDTRAYFDPPLHRQRLYARYYQAGVEPLRHTESISRRILCLPIHGGVTDAMAEHIVERVTARAEELAAAARTAVPA